MARQVIDSWSSMWSQVRWESFFFFYLLHLDTVSCYFFTVPTYQAEIRWCSRFRLPVLSIFSDILIISVSNFMLRGRWPLWIKMDACLTWVHLPWIGIAYFTTQESISYKAIWGDWPEMTSDKPMFCSTLILITILMVIWNDKTHFVCRLVSMSEKNRKP